MRETWRINSRIKAEAGRRRRKNKISRIGAQEYGNNLAASGEKTRVFVLMMR